MKKFDINFTKPNKQKLIGLLELYQTRRYFDAEKLSQSITQEFPEHQFAWKVLGATLKQTGRINESLFASQKSVQLNPQDAEAHNSLAVTLHFLGKFKDAKSSYGQAIILKPDYAEAYCNLALTLRDLGRLEDSESSCKQAIILKPDYAEAHNNLGNLLKDKGELIEAIDCYKRVLNIQPNFTEAWNNIFFTLQAIKLESSSVKDHIPLLNKQNTDNKYAHIAKSILNYRLNLGSTFADTSLNEVLSTMSITDNSFIKNSKVTFSELAEPALPKKITTMTHFGRSGTGLLHSLIDGHPEVSTLPSIYFSEFFDLSTWEKIIIGGWEEMADRFTTIYEVLFDASSAFRVPSKNNKFIDNIGRKEGMTNVGKERKEILSLDKKIFIKELNRLMGFYDQLDALTFFKLVHSAYEKTLNNNNKKNHIFYHIHNPNTYAQLNFLRLAPNANWLMMVREPLQSCESWVKKGLDNNDYKGMVNKIFQMLFEVDQTIFRNKNSIGVRLEDLKNYPKKTIQALCRWLDIEEKESLYQMTVQNKKWWGDPTSPDYAKDGMNPFGKASINRKLGSVFSKNDQFILHTLFYPFSVRFGYVEENLEQFKKDLNVVRPMLDQMFDFEKKINQYSKINSSEFMKTGPYLYLRSGMIERWNTLNKFHTYPNMLTVLKID